MTFISLTHMFVLNFEQKALDSVDYGSRLTVVLLAAGLGSEVERYGGCGAPSERFEAGPVHLREDSPLSCKVLFSTSLGCVEFTSSSLLTWSMSVSR